MASDIKLEEQSIKFEGDWVESRGTIFAPDFVIRVNGKDDLVLSEILGGKKVIKGTIFAEDFVIRTNEGDLLLSKILGGDGQLTLGSLQANKLEILSNTPSGTPWQTPSTMVDLGKELFNLRREIRDLKTRLDKLEG